MVSLTPAIIVIALTLCFSLLVCKRWQQRKQNDRILGLLGLENEALRIQNHILSDQNDYFYGEALNARSSKDLLALELQSIQARMDQQNQMRRAMMNILNDAEIARKEAESLSTIKGQFLANMSHEIRTPLNGIIGMNQLLHSTDLNEEQKELIDTSLGAANTLLGIVNDVLDFSKIEAGAVTLDYHDFDLLKLLDEVIATLSGTAIEQGIDLNSDTDVKLPTLLIGDSFRIKQILLNFANNAIRFTESGDVLIRATLIDREKDDLVVRFSVKDSGIGIPEEKQATLFKPFSQVDGSITRKYGGTGLGLVIAKSLAEAMLGEVHFKSTPGTGSTFWFDIPLKKQSKGSHMSFQMPKGLLSKHFIILDDHQKRSSLLKSYLNEWGCQHIEQFGKSDFNFLKTHNIKLLQSCDIVLVDGEMLDENNEPIATQLRRISKHWHPDIVVMSKWGRESEWRSELGQSIDGILTTPIRQQALVSRLTELIPDEKKRNVVKTVEAEISPIPENSKILVVEDNKVNQKVVDRLLVRLGCYVACVGDGVQALKILEEETFDLVLMDFQMPIMDGLTATEHIRRLQSPVSEIPIIGLTANVIQREKERALRIGMNDYLSKPIVFDDLKKAIATQLMSKFQLTKTSAPF